MLYIERVQVDEGFLDGLDVQFRRGLNVVIGARGSGKTSLIELIRFCLGAPAFTDKAAERGYQQALSVLRGGQVTVTMRDDQQSITVVRSASDDSPRATGPTPDVTILAQGEIEAVGSRSSGRLHLIDRLRPERQDIDTRSAQLRAEIKSITTEVRDLLLEVDDMELAVEQSADVPAELDRAVEMEAAALESAQATKADSEQLESLQKESAELKVRRSVFQRAIEEMGSLDADLNRIVSRPVMAESWPESAGEQDLLHPIRARLGGALEQLTETRGEVALAIHEIEGLLQADVNRGVEIDTASREIRTRLDQVREGVGAITRQVEALRERAGQLAALRQRLQQKRALAGQRVTLRDDLYLELDQLRQDRFESRLSIARAVTDELGPTIEVEATRSDETRGYSDAIVSGLRGSGLHYNTLSPQLAGSMSPLELIHAVESREPEAIADATDIPIQRASAIVQTLKGSDLASIVAAPIDDGIDLHLLDGSVYKESQEVSIGQRCTIVLPVLLTRHGDVLVVDQPEDNLDNSFITSTVVLALRNRHPDDQLLFASHNANIPVLGDADLVIALDSDGKRGWVDHSAPLDDQATVAAITRVMEGGVDAFRRRAEFYGVLPTEH